MIFPVLDGQTRQYRRVQNERKKMLVQGLILLAMWLVLSGENAALGQTATDASSNTNVVAAYKAMSLRQLMDIEVTSVAKHPEKWLVTPSAIEVVTHDEIERSGASSLPEALRLSPNLQVAQVNSHDWAISARGFNNTTANKLLVMIDGRTIYTPLYAGVFWDAQSVLLEDVDRIEVVSGPGGTLWGANAVNGVINITTKSARDTQGTYVSGGGGSWLQDFGAVRYGGSVGSNLFYRVYGQRSDRDSAVNPNGSDGTNAWDMTQGGFRMDYYPSEVNTLTLQGDVYDGSEEQPGQSEVKLDGENILGRWTRTFSEDSDLNVQMYFDRTWRDAPGTFAEDLKTYDFDFQDRFPLGERQGITWGAGYRFMPDHVRNSAALAFLPPDRDMPLYSGFLQDEIALVPDRLKLTLGTKLEHNDFSGFEVQPSARLAWTPDERQTVWAAVSRAVRSPSRIDSDFYIPGTPPYLLAGGTNFDSEKLIAYELGYRMKPLDRLSCSVSAFYNFYDDLRSIDVLSSGQFVLGNHFRGETWGAEASVNYEATTWWRLRAGYDFLHKQLWPTTSSAIPSAREGDDPNNQIMVQSSVDLPAHFQIDFTARYVDSLPSPAVPSYLSFDARLAWQYKNLEIAIVGQNLADDQHAEFRGSATAPAQEIPRSVFGKVTLRF